MRPPGTAAHLEARRRRAADLLADGMSLAKIARRVGADVSSVKRWKRALREGGDDALAAKPHPGRPAKLSVDQKQRLALILRAGPLAAGFRTDLWTTRRVAEVIRQRFGVGYHPDHVGRLLHALGFSRQKPQRRARQRDEAAIERWRCEDWPRIKKGRRRQAVIVFLDETALQLQPVSRHTWAPRGETPIQYVSARHDRMSLIGAISLSPRRQRINTYFRFHDDNVRAPDVISFLRHLCRQQQRRMIVVLDRLNVHRSAVRQLKDRSAPWLEVEWLPAYAPDLNPVEAMWSSMKHGDLANFLPNDLYELGDAVVDSLFRQRNDRRIKESYFHTARLDL